MAEGFRFCLANSLGNVALSLKKARALVECLGLLLSWNFSLR